MQLEYLPLENIIWDKPLGDYYNILLALLSLYKFDLLPQKEGAANVFRKIVNNIELYAKGGSYDIDDVKFVIDIYYLLTCWQRDLKFKTRFTFVLQDVIKRYLTNIFIITTNICTIALTAILFLIAIKAIFSA
jgi:hypothetical protein